MSGSLKPCDVDYGCGNRGTCGTNGRLFVIGLAALLCNGEDFDGMEGLYGRLAHGGEPTCAEERDAGKSYIK